MRIAILVIEVVLVALVQPATAREEQHISIPHGPLNRDARFIQLRGCLSEAMAQLTIV
jgi:hypothetical protein